MVNVVSTNPAEGKSSVASNLATVSVAKYANVLLIDCDLRKPVQHKIFKVSNKMGLSNLMRNFDSFDVNDDTYFQKFKDNTSDGRLFLLTSGVRVPNPGELL
ncbi:tyrosine-protein kinase family protein, partial [[Eubacterium] hominis]|uniref:tyrosine-protein kinase family protein n=1 Tax=[Eubacterium] hominis TaxID=2764325 RepID=UPI003A4E0303